MHDNDGYDINTIQHCFLLSWHSSVFSRSIPWPAFSRPISNHVNYELITISTIQWLLLRVWGAVSSVNIIREKLRRGQKVRFWEVARTNMTWLNTCRTFCLVYPPPGCRFPSSPENIRLLPKTIYGEHVFQLRTLYTIGDAWYVII